jgi:hypothetical protein
MERETGLEPATSSLGSNMTVRHNGQRKRQQHPDGCKFDGAGE